MFKLKCIFIVAMSVHLKCKKCRHLLCQDYVKTYDCDTCCSGRVPFDVDNSPTWIQSALKEGIFVKGKLQCPRCGAKVGSFDFTAPTKCECGKVHSNVWLTSSKVDVQELSPQYVTSSQADNTNEHHVKSKVCETQSSIDSTIVCEQSERTSYMTESVDCARGNSSLSPNETLELGKKKVSEVALSLTRKGRECVANLCAGLSVDAHLSEIRGHNRHATPLTSDDETDTSTNDMGFQPFQDGVQSAFRDPLLLSEDERSRESTPAVEKQSSVADANDSSDKNSTDTASNHVNPEPFTCSVCLEIYYLPQKCDPCEHVFCDPCLRQVNSSASGSDVNCPLCRKVIKKCSTYEDLWKATKVLFPAEYQERHKIERRKRKHRPLLPGCVNGRSRANRRANGGGSNVLAMWAGVCFVLLFMMLGFTVFATTVGFVAWYFLEIAMDLLVDLTLEFQTFSEVFKTSIILFCIDGGLSDEKWRQLYDSAGRVLGAFTKLVHAKNTTHGATDVPMSGTQEDSAKPYHVVWKITQTNLANYVVFGCLVTFVMYRLAKFMQARRL